MVKKHLVIVESPAKARTIEKFLGPEYQVMSSFGHIRDLPKKGMSIDIENNFTPEYEVSSDKKKIVAELRKAAKEAEQVWLASDEDREGEAIAWHLSEALKLDISKTKRIVFQEITKTAILAAIDTPRTVNIELVNAQQARRILDRIVGYELSPVLWKKVRPGLSAGRVQSVAVRIIVEREREIISFKSSASFKVSALFTLSDGTELKAESPVRLDAVVDAKTLLKELAFSDFTVASIEKTPGVRNPGPPFTTSTLQQAASSRLGYSPKQTMMLAQRLYEAGKITYMRTDSVHLSTLAIGQMADFIKNEYGDKYLKIRSFTTKSAGAQEAHEAIRPTNAATLSAGADEQQKKLYQLIWRRALASQMAQASLEKTTISVAASKSKTQLIAKGEIVVFDGFLKLDPPKKSVDDPAADGLLPPLIKGDVLSLVSAEAAETLSRGPARYTEASLVRKLEEMGIGRPSTYAPTISTVQDRGYVVKGDIEGNERDLIVVSVLPKSEITETTTVTVVGADRNKLLPTDTGNVVTDFLVKNFPNIVDYDFTKDVEAEFDNIAEGRQEWHKMLASFYGPFHKTVEDAADISRAEASQARKIGVDPKSGKPITARYARFGPIVARGDVDNKEEKLEFAGIPSGLSVDSITIEQALKLFELPRLLGNDKQGNEIQANVGRFGPYVKVGSSFVSIKGHDPHSITLSEALELLKEDVAKKAARTIKLFEGSSIQVLNGRFGAYITDGKKNAKIPKGTEPSSLTLEECTKLIEEAPTAKGRFKRKTKK